MSSVVYFVVAGDPPEAVKIGTTFRDAQVRLDAIQTGNHLPVRLLGTVPGDRSVERALHRRFAHLWLRGEWFRWDPSLVAFVRSDPSFPFCDLRKDSAFVGLFGRGYEQLSFYRAFARDPFGSWWHFEDRMRLVVGFNPLEIRGGSVETLHGKLLDAASFGGKPDNAALLRLLSRARELAA